MPLADKGVDGKNNTRTDLKRKNYMTLLTGFV